MTQAEGALAAGASRRAGLRAAAAVALPLLVGLWALWRDVWMLEAEGLRYLGGSPAISQWAALTALTLGLGWLCRAGARPLRLLALTAYALMLSVGFGAAAVLGVMHAFGGPQGNLTAPTWALVALGALCLILVLALLATAGLIVDEVRQADAEQVGTSGP